MKSLQTAKFYWNGIKVGGKLYRCWYGFDRSNGVIHITAKSYATQLPHGIGLDVRNDTRIEVDYFAHAKAAVGQDHPLFPQVLQAVLAYEARSQAAYSARIAKATTTSMHK